VRELKLHPRRELNRWGYCFADCEMHPVTADYIADPAVPLITVCQDMTDSPHQAPAIRSFEGGCGVELDDAHYARFCRQDGRWNVLEAGRRNLP
jgi:hypothetical protein